ncbi:hypothetical protein E2562_022049 [Oryza meyeriana var. granulata]|uniref:Uncharacterized protein n=1 Tax=Oryza meyeriana var. granulata TaxID=110450 RepID=A0A6G1ENK6_9ORYZ|nr:hypothetical protein E2562_022049 [Oryza meyeriana var. granulata]
MAAYEIDSPVRARVAHSRWIPFRATWHVPTPLRHSHSRSLSSELTVTGDGEERHVHGVLPSPPLGGPTALFHRARRRLSRGHRDSFTCDELLEESALFLPPR